MKKTKTTTIIPTLDMVFDEPASDNPTKLDAGLHLVRIHHLEVEPDLKYVDFVCHTIPFNKPGAPIIEFSYRRSVKSGKLSRWLIHDCLRLGVEVLNAEVDEWDTICKGQPCLDQFIGKIFFADAADNKTPYNYVQVKETEQYSKKAIPVSKKDLKYYVEAEYPETVDAVIDVS